MTPAIVYQDILTRTWVVRTRDGRERTFGSYEDARTCYRSL